ncbi:MAG: LysR family transcriptional regulator [Sneathiella sp.]|nr:LysR family transcriptional regulator [Sneathiella sp.]
MSSFKDMAAFVAVVEQQSFSKAGRELRLSTAVVSARVAKLEQHLGVRLLNRTTRQVSPTEEALEFYEECKKILSQVEVAEAVLASRKASPSGALRVTAPVVFGRKYLAPLLRDFQKQVPDLQIRLSLTDEFVDLVADGVDVAIRIAPLKDSSLKSLHLGASPRILCAAPRYLRQFGEPESLQDLLNHNCLLLRFPGSSQFQWHFEVDGKSQAIAVKGNLDSNNGDVIRDWALAGAGIVLKSRWEVAEYLASGELVQILPAARPLSVNISALYAGGGIQPPKIRLFLDFLKEGFQAVPDFSSASGGI